MCDLLICHRESGSRLLWQTNKSAFEPVRFMPRSNSENQQGHPWLKKSPLKWKCRSLKKSHHFSVNQNYLKYISGWKTGVNYAAAIHVQHKAENSAIQGQMCKINMKRNIAAQEALSPERHTLVFLRRNLKLMCVSKYWVKQSQSGGCLHPLTEKCLCCISSSSLSRKIIYMDKIDSP